MCISSLYVMWSGAKGGCFECVRMNVEGFANIRFVTDFAFGVSNLKVV